MTLSLIIEASDNLEGYNPAEVVASVNIPSIINFYLSNGFHVADFNKSQAVRAIVIFSSGRLVDKTIMKDYFSDGSTDIDGVLPDDILTYALPHISNKSQRLTIISEIENAREEWRYNIESYRYRDMHYSGIGDCENYVVTPEDVIYCADQPDSSIYLESMWEGWDYTAAERDEIMRVAVLNNPRYAYLVEPAPPPACTYPTLFSHLSRGYSKSIVRMLEYLDLHRHARLYTEMHETEF